MTLTLFSSVTSLTPTFCHLSDPDLVSDPDLSSLTLTLTLFPSVTSLTLTCHLSDPTFCHLPDPDILLSP